MKPEGPFSGLIVVDLTRVLAGPYCTMLLADMGARVIKVERPDTGDDARHIGPFIEGKSAYFMSLNRGKESIGLDLKSEDDRKIFESLLGRADLLVENYRAGTMEKLGYGWEELHERFPKLIYAAASGFGHTGPYVGKPAYDMVVQGMGGIMSLTGHPGNPPTRVGTSIGDISAGLFTTVGVTSALYHRERTGEGMKIDVSMLDCQVALLENAIARLQSTGESPGPIGSRHPSITPFQAFKVTDGHIIIAAGNNRLFGTLCESLGATELKDDARFATNESRCDHWEELQGEIEKRLAVGDADTWLDKFEDAGVPCAPINNVEQVLNDPQVLERKMVVTAEDPEAGEIKMAGNPIKLSSFADSTVRASAPDLDADRAAILRLIEDDGDGK